MHVRLLLALPLLILAELVVHQRMRPVVGQFLDARPDPGRRRGRSSTRPSPRRCACAIRSAAEVLLIAFVYVVGVGFIWRTQVALDVTSWYGVPVDGRLAAVARRLVAGLVSLPLFQFLLLRWYFRLFIWARFLWQVSRIELKLMPTHPDRCGGLGFLRCVSHAFAPVLLAQGAVLAGMIANRIFYAGAKLPEFKVELDRAGGRDGVRRPRAAAGVRSEAGAAKRAGLREYGTLAQRYVREFDRNGCAAARRPDEPLVGSADIQSLADLGNSFEVVKEDAVGAVHHADRAATGGHHAAARAAADADDDFARGVARAAPQDRFLTQTPKETGPFVTRPSATKN